MTPHVIIYGLTDHPATDVAQQFLQQKGVTDIEMAYVDIHEDLRKEMWVRSGFSRTIPQIYIGDQHVGTLSEIVELDRQGGLDPLLNAG